MSGNAIGPFREATGTIVYETWKATSSFDCDMCGRTIPAGSHYVKVLPSPDDIGFGVPLGLWARQHGDNHDACTNEEQR